MQQRRNQRFMTDEFDQSPTSDEDNWRNLASFGVERNQDFDLNEEFGAVAADVDIEGTIELVGQMNAGFATHEMSLRVSFICLSSLWSLLCEVCLHRTKILTSSFIQMKFYPLWQS